VLDKHNRGEIGSEEFERLLNLLKIGGYRREAIVGLIKDFDCDKNAFLNLDEFGNMISPQQKEYRILLNCRVDQESVRNGDQLEDVRIFPLNFSLTIFSLMNFSLTIFPLCF
jgi:hypothetical protein